ncbi:MAG TPA: ATP-binding protein [Candidatus Izemoplasmatales bacterium]|nr:ATP-binding protein [Candidatus Izemoplasmatales bacterium]
MIIKRDKYVNQLIRKKQNGLIKIITGIRRCGKSYLLFELYHAYLNSIGVEDNYIIELSLDDEVNAKYRNPLELGQHIRSLITDKDKDYFIFLDEIQQVKEIRNPYLEDPNEKISFVDVLLGLMKIKNADIYVTGSNSKMLSSDIVTQFRDRGDEIRLYPLYFKEFYDAFSGNKDNAWKEYYTYGGLPRVMSLSTHKDKSDYLQSLFKNTYMKDVIDRHNIRNDKQILDDLINMISSAVGSLTNPKKLSDTFKSTNKTSINSTTIDIYLDYFEEAFIIDVARRYDIKGKKYIGTPVKYYFTDIGLRNARLNFRQQEENHIMENILFFELKARGYNVDIGVVEYRHLDKNDKDVRSQLEVDFVANDGGKIYYIQSALSVDEEGKRKQEINSLRRIPDSFKKIVIVKDDIMPWNDDNGILYIGIKDFLLDANAINM